MTIARRRSRTGLLVAIGVLIGSILAPSAATAKVAPTDDETAVATPTALSSGQLTVVRVVGGLSSPIGVTHAGDGSGRLFVVQQGGRVRIVSGGRVTGTFIDVDSRTTGGGERGLLGLAFHPDFATNGYVYLYYTTPGGDIRVSRYTADPTRTSASLSTEYHLITIEHSQFSNHNGGAIAFGPDGYLYVGTGDGGSSNDPGNNGQNKNTLLGKILRIDVNGTGAGIHGNYAIPAGNPFVGATPGAAEVWAWGLRNPWRISFDRTTGDLYIGDVGQGRWEEVDRELATSSGGLNYGWRIMEGAHCRVAGCTPPANDVLPVAEYSHTYGCSITGGYVYRGSHRDLQGLYVYGDYCSGRLWTMNANGTGETIRRDTSLNITSFGESESGELYLTDIGGGALYRVIAPEFSDIAGSTFLDHIHWMFYEGITAGCGSGKFCPKASVTRVQMAQFLVRAFDYPTTTTDYFTDDNGIVGESSINALAEAGITGGCAPNLFCPSGRVTRAQMAIFLTNALSLPPSGTDYFDDDDGKTGESSINAMAAAGLTGGCGTRKYCPTANVTREQMAAFLRRALTP